MPVFKHNICQLHDTSEVHAEFFHFLFLSKVAKHFIYSGSLSQKNIFSGQNLGFLKEISERFEFRSDFVHLTNIYLFQITAF